jgi:hypothetical protein
MTNGADRPAPARLTPAGIELFEVNSVINRGIST